MVLQPLPSFSPSAEMQESQRPIVTECSHSFKSRLPSTVASVRRKRAKARPFNDFRDKCRFNDHARRLARQPSPFVNLTLKPSTPSGVAGETERGIEEQKGFETGQDIYMPSPLVVLPRHLARPPYRDIDPAVVLAIEPDLSHTPMEYIRDNLQAAGPSMLAVLAATSATPVRTALPKEIAITVKIPTSNMPTHMLALHSRQPASFNNRRKITLVPIHGIILSAHCANLPALPPSRPATPDATGSPVTLPVVPICIPSPETFPQLCTYLYTKRADHLLSALLPSPPVPAGADHGSTKAALQLLARKLAAEYLTYKLMQYAMIINGMWRNVCALGIFDDKLWTTMGVAWQVILTAIAVKTGQSLIKVTENSSTVVPDPQSSPS